jgi:peptidoglycan/LPS O-acetylase OafA/YrhL
LERPSGTMGLKMQVGSGHKYIPTLNGWRAFSILYVLIFHGSWSYFVPSPGTYLHPEMWNVIKNGSFGVYFFFGISGFLITTRLLEERNHFGRISLKSFYWRRAFRILPIIFAFLGVIQILRMNNLVDVPSSSILSSILFYRNYSPNGYDWYTGHFWSLSMEEHFYLIWPGLCILALKTKRPWIPILGLLAAVAAWRSIEYRYQILTPHLDGITWKWRTDLFFDYMLWGSFAAYCNSLPRFKEAFGRFARSWMIFPAIAIMHWLLFHTVPFQDIWQAISIQICILLTVNFPTSSFSKFLENKAIAQIGVYSYSLYVWQQLFLVPGNQRIHGVEMLQTFPVNVALLILVAYASFRWVETPAIEKGRRLLKKTRFANQ